LFFTTVCDPPRNGWNGTGVCGRKASTDPDGTKNRVTGRYLVVRPPERLVFTWQWQTSEAPIGGAPRAVPPDAAGIETLVTVDFASHGGGTLLARRDLERFAPVLERHLRDRTHMVGDDTTLADYAVGHLQGFKDLVPFDWSRFPAINAFYERLADDPHWAATAPRDPAAIGRRPS